MFRRAHGGWGQSIASAFSNLLNALLFNGHPDQTLSARLGEAQVTGLGGKWTVFARKIVNGFFHIFGEKDHVKKEIEADTERTYKP